MFFAKTIDEITAEITCTAEHYHRAANAWEAVQIKKRRPAKSLRTLAPRL